VRRWNNLISFGLGLAFFKPFFQFYSLLYNASDHFSFVHQKQNLLYAYNASTYRDRLDFVRKKIQEPIPYVSEFGICLLVSNCIQRDTKWFTCPSYRSYIFAFYTKKYVHLRRKKGSLYVFVHRRRIPSQFCFIFVHIWSYRFVYGDGDIRS